MSQILNNFNVTQHLHVYCKIIAFIAKGIKDIAFMYVSLYKRINNGRPDKFPSGTFRNDQHKKATERIGEDCDGQ